jgi:hypothetical protein
MAYSTSNPPAMITQRVGADGGAMWIYNSTDAAIVVRKANYISNADALGMKIGDLVFHTDTAGATLGQIYLVVTVTAGGAADLSDGTAITATNTD